MTDCPHTVWSNDKRANDRSPAEVLAFLNELIAAGVPNEAQATRDATASDMVWHVASALADCNAKTIAERGVAATYWMLARAAIEAMREPTPEMLTAAAAVAYDTRIMGQDGLAAVMMDAMVETALRSDTNAPTSL